MEGVKRFDRELQGLAPAGQAALSPTAAEAREGGRVSPSRGPLDLLEMLAEARRRVGLSNSPHRLRAPRAQRGTA